MYHAAGPLHMRQHGLCQFLRPMLRSPVADPIRYTPEILLQQGVPQQHLTGSGVQRQQINRVLTSNASRSRGCTALGAAVVYAERPRAKRYDLEQSTGYHHVLEEVDHLILVGKVAVE